MHLGKDGEERRELREGRVYGRRVDGWKWFRYRWWARGAGTWAEKAKDLYYKNLKDGMMSSLVCQEEFEFGNDKPEDYYYNSKYHETFPIFWNYLDYCAVPSVQILDREDFNNGIIIVIIVAGINVGIQTVPLQITQAWSSWLFDSSSIYCGMCSENCSWGSTSSFLHGPGSGME